MAAAALKHGIVWLPSRGVGERALVGEPVLQALMPRAPAGAVPQQLAPPVVTRLAASP